MDFLQNNANYLWENCKWKCDLSGNQKDDMDGVVIPTPLLFRKKKSIPVLGDFLGEGEGEFLPVGSNQISTGGNF